MNWSLSGLSGRRLLDAAGAADDLARDGNEGGRIIAGVAGQAIADETVSRWWS